jgi:hypothetical protein
MTNSQLQIANDQSATSKNYSVYEAWRPEQNHREDFPLMHGAVYVLIDKL